MSGRQDILVVEVSQLNKVAADKAMTQWGQPNSKITHLVFCTTSSRTTATRDYQLVKLIGLEPSVQRFTYQPGCFSGDSVLRLFNDFSRSNHGSRVVLVFSEVTPAPSRARPRPRGESSSREALQRLQVRQEVTSAEVKKLRSENERLREKELEARIRAKQAEDQVRRQRNKTSAYARALLHSV